MSPEKLAESVERVKAALNVREMSGEVLAGPPKGKGLVSFAKCGRNGECVDEARVFDGDMRMVIVKSRCICAGFCPSLDGYDWALKLNAASGVEE